MAHRVVDDFKIIKVKHDADRRLPEDLLAVEKLLAGAFVGQTA